MTMLFVTYAGDASTRFDRDYYVSTHLPLVMEAWSPYGLETAAAFFPSNDGAGTIAVCVCGFRNEASITTAINSPQTERVMSDVKHFTDVQPSQSLAVPL